MSSIPNTQYAVQLTGPGEMRLNKEKPVSELKPTQFLAKVEAVGLCFSDLKLLKQFSGHVRKSPVTSGLSEQVLSEIPSYVPGEKPTVPGHEVVCRVVAAGSAVKEHHTGNRYLVQADYRAWPTAGANAAFGYNFEGALQEYVLFDERVMIAPNGDHYLIPVEDTLGASQAALAEPWACVEDSYVTPERQTIKPNGRLLIVAEDGHAIEGVAKAFAPVAKPAKVTAFCANTTQREAIEGLGIDTEFVPAIDALPTEAFDDIVYFGAKKQTVEALNSRLAARGIMNVVLGGRKFGAPVSVGVGRVHYGLTRWVGTTGSNAAESYTMIAATGELRENDRVLVVGAGGPMGQMHALRSLCAPLKGIAVVATDFDNERLAGLARKAEPFTRANGAAFETVNPNEQEIPGQFTYITIMAPVGALVAQAIGQASPGAIVNVFAGVPAPVCHELDLDALIEKRVFLFGTSGSTVEDMKIVLDKVRAGTLNTNASVDAISGMAGAIEGIAAVENRTMAGKIIVYPMLRDVGLIPLAKLAEHFPAAAAKLDNGQWCKAAEDELIRSGV